jgi:hypothetical protein
MHLTLSDGLVAATLLIQAVIAFLFLGGLWFIVDKFTRFDDYREISINKNWAYLIQRYGMLIAATLGVGSSFNFSGRWSSIGFMAIGSAWVILVVLFVYPFVERVFGTSNPHDAYRDNMTASLTKAAAYFAIGMVLSGALSGSAPNGTTAIAATGVFTLLGLVVMPLAVFLHMRGFKRSKLKEGKRFGLLIEARECKLQAGFELAGVLIALGILLRNAITGDFVGWLPGLLGFGITFGISLVLLYVYRIVGDKLVFHHISVHGAQSSDTEGPAILLALLLPVTAYIVSMVVTPIAGIFA